MKGLPTDYSTPAGLAEYGLYRLTEAMEAVAPRAWQDETAAAIFNGELKAAAEKYAAARLANAGKCIECGAKALDNAEDVPLCANHS